MYIKGVSTRKVAEITEALCGTSFSKSQVSELASWLDTDLLAWRERPLTAESYPYLFVDARYEHVRVDGQVVSQGVLVVSAIRDDGRREIVAVDVADTESEATYHDLFRRLKQRGLAGVRLVASDDHAGLRAAIARHSKVPVGSAARSTPCGRNPELSGAGPDGSCDVPRNGMTWRISSVSSPTITRSMSNCKIACFSSNVASSRRVPIRSQKAVRSVSTA